MVTEPRLLAGLVRPSLAKSAEWRDRFEHAVSRQGLPLELCWRQTDPSGNAEGLYVKVESDREVLGRYKFVRHSFTQTILDSGSHHAARPILPNELAPGSDVFAPELSCTWEDLGLRTIKGLDALRAQAPSNDKKRKERS
jgi:hypothetical protein